jgi:F-type H+-transporting ATPase subunit epsilon
MIKDVPKLRLDIVSAEKALFSGDVVRLSATGLLGELGIGPGHAPLLTALKPGLVEYSLDENKHEVIYISGGMLEVQPHEVTILADTAVRADDLDEAAANAARDKAQQALEHSGEIDYSVAATRLAEALAQIRAIQTLRKRK